MNADQGMGSGMGIRAGDGGWGGGNGVPGMGSGLGCQGVGRESNGVSGWGMGS